MSSMLVHDARLAGQSPTNLADNIYEVDGSVSIQQAVDWIKAYASNQSGLDNLYIMCHGYEANWNLGDQTCTPFQAGGFGLALCAEGLDLSNVNLTAAWKGLINAITIFACATADTGTGNEGTIGDGKRFCGDGAPYGCKGDCGNANTMVFDGKIILELDYRSGWDHQFWYVGRAGL